MIDAAAQDDRPVRKSDGAFDAVPAPVMIPNSGSSEFGKVMGAPDMPVQKDKFNDAELTDLERQMAERELGTEEGEWEAACRTNTYEAYQRYSARYPNGAHAAEAARRMIDLNVNNIFQSSHSPFPKLNRDFEDDQAENCTVTIENRTDYPMTVMFSGATSKSITIRPEGRGSVTLKTGTYRIGASVTKAGVRPFAGTQKLFGGHYRTAFTIVYR